MEVVVAFEPILSRRYCILTHNGCMVWSDFEHEERNQSRAALQASSVGCLQPARPSGTPEDLTGHNNRNLVGQPARCQNINQSCKQAKYWSSEREKVMEQLGTKCSLELHKSTELRLTNQLYFALTILQPTAFAHLDYMHSVLSAGFVKPPTVIMGAQSCIAIGRA